VVQTRFDPPDYFSVLVSATPISGSLELQKLISNIYVVAEGSSKLGRNGCGSSTPAPTLLSRGVIEGGSLVVPDGLAVTGYICFQIGSVEPASLALVTEPPLSTAFPPSAPDADARWFALR
jgi:hypothetical protein